MSMNITIAAGQKEAFASISRSVMVPSAAGTWGSVGAKGRAAEGTDLEGKETGTSIVKSCRRSAQAAAAAVARLGQPGWPLGRCHCGQVLSAGGVLLRGAVDGRPHRHAAEQAQRLRTGGGGKASQG